MRTIGTVWEPPQPLLKCVECGLEFRYDGYSVGCPGCSSDQRAIVVEPAEREQHQADRSRPIRSRKPRSTGPLRQRFLIFKRDGYRCQMCGASASKGARLECDHKIPKSRGGRTIPENLWTLCFECNRGRSNEPL